MWRTSGIPYSQKGGLSIGGGAGTTYVGLLSPVIGLP